MNTDLSIPKNQVSSHVEIKRVTWSKDSHGLFDYESKNVQFSKSKVEVSSDIFKDGSDISIRPAASSTGQMEVEDPDYLFSIIASPQKKDKFFIKAPRIEQYESSKPNLFLIVRSLKDEAGVQKGYALELGDIIRLGRIEYRVVEYQDHTLNRFSMFDLDEATQTGPFNLTIKHCGPDPDTKHQCRICFRDEEESEEILVNPCNCKGTSAYVHIACLQMWINSKVKTKTSTESTCSYWKHLSCEVCKTPLPDIVNYNGTKIQLVPAVRPEKPYMLVERIFYDKSKGGDNSRMMVLLSLTNEAHQLKLGRGHECDIRENDISVSRLHAFIKYQDSKFVIVDNNSKFGTLILLTRELEIEKRKIAIQFGRTVITFSLKHSTVNNVPVSKQPTLIESVGKSQAQGKGAQGDFDKMNDFNYNDDDFEN